MTSPHPLGSLRPGTLKLGVMVCALAIAVPITAMGQRPSAPGSGGASVVRISDQHSTAVDRAQVRPESCTTCHAFSEGTSHPVNVLASGPTPHDLPLQAGRITCLTCHEDRAREDHSRTNGRGDPMLRRDPDSEGLCMSCHTNSSRASDAHAIGVRSAHGGPRDSRAARTSFGMDSESHTCISCHDGSAAMDAGGHTMMRMGFGSAVEHPIGVELVTRNAGTPSEVRFVSPQSRDPRVRLYDGKVGCGSCHSVYSALEDHLVVENTQSRLCLSCHVE